MLLRRALHARGFRFRLHSGELAGHPDISLRKYNAVIFVHGCFWHRHENCRLATTPETRPEFWLRKFAGNVDRDARNISELLQRGWRVGVVWECALKKKRADVTIEEVARWLEGQQTIVEIG